MLTTTFFLLLLILALCPLATIVTPPAPAGCLDRRQAAQYLSISVRLLDKLASEGQLSRVKIGTKTLFRVSDLDDFIETKIQRLKPGA